jgi:diguanylate cyclase (GGDEF)-like protein
MPILPAPLERPKVLAIDDERFNLNTLHGLLKDEYRMMVATSGEQGLRAAATGRPDLILLDISMPDMDGYEVCRRLKADPLTLGIPVIFITALTDAADETRGLDLGAADYITKPFNLAVVKARVRTQIRLKLQSDLLESYAFRDGLTGLANRRALDEQLQREWQRALRTGGELAGLLMDVDHFKRYNDHYGHARGDECLRSVAACIDAQLQGVSCLAARYGGEEFAVLLNDASLEAAVAVGEALRAGIEAARIEHQASPLCPYVTISVGVASLRPAPGFQPMHLFETADRMLYAVKSAGRNGVRGRLPPSGEP